MDPNQQKKPPSDNDIKEAARNGRSGAGPSRPGVVPVNEAAALDQRIAEKTRSAYAAPASASASATVPAPPQELDQLERDISAKRKNAPAFAAATPGAYSAQPSKPSTAHQAASARAELSNFESDVAAKQRARAPHATAIEGLDQKVAAKVAASSSAGSRELHDLEASVQAKLNSNTREGNSRNHPMQQHSPAAAAVSDAKPPASWDDLSRLDERIAAKSASAGTAVPRSLQETEDIVTKKKTNGIMHGEIQTAPQSKSPPEQSPQQAKEEGLELHPQGLQPHGDVEYGEFGGPTEQGLAVAFAVEEETEDAFIPAAIEYDPDAKPPLIKNRRFRLYAFLTVIAVLVAVISAAVGITLAGKKNTYDDIPDRFSSGVREAVISLVGAEKLEDPASPHAKALDWIQNKDPLQLLPSNPTFVQRYILALFYYSTSVKRPWMAGCAPAVDDETDECVYERLLEITNDQGKTNEKIPSIRWLSGTTECAWAGIQCTGERPGDVKHVRSIRLSGANMTGIIPEELGQLNLLQTLSIRFNEFGGPVPEYLARFRHLVKLDLHNNKFTGTVPSNLFASPTIQRLDLSRNNLVGTIPTAIGQMIDAKEVFLGFNELTGSLPTEVGRLHSITTLWVQANILTGTLPTELGNLGHINNLIMFENLFSGELPSALGELKFLADFKVSDNNLQGQLPSGLYKLQYLFTLDVANNKLTGTVSSDIAGMFALDNLLLRFNDFSGTIPNELGLLKQLDNVQLSGNRFNGTITTELCPQQRGQRGFDILRKLIADCLPDGDGVPPEIECECCTVCCDSNTTFCKEL